MLRLLVLACVATLLPRAANAQPVRDVGELAVTLAYDFCLPCTEGRVRLDGPELKALGFSGPIKRISHPRVGPIEMVELSRSDGSLTFAVSPEATFCQVNVVGANSAVAHAKLRNALPRLGQKFEPDPAASFTRDGLQVETVNTQLDSETTLFVQFIRASGPAADMAGFQIGALER